MQLRCAVCDDEREFREILLWHLNKFAKENEIKITVQEYESGESLLQTDIREEIIFLDIDMQGKDGLEVGQEIWRRNRNIYIIYITNLGDLFSKKTAQNRIHAFAFLEKPLCPKELYEQLQDICQQISAPKQEGWSICLKVIGKGMMTFPVRDIYYLEYTDHKIRLVLKQKEGSMVYYVQDRLINIIKRLQPCGFLQPHKSFLVNIRLVQRVRQYVVYMLNGDEIPLSQKRAAKFRKAWYGQIDNETFGR